MRTWEHLADTLVIQPLWAINDDNVHAQPFPQVLHRFCFARPRWALRAPAAVQVQSRGQSDVTSTKQGCHT